MMTAAKSCSFCRSDTLCTFIEIALACMCCFEAWQTAKLEVLLSDTSITLKSRDAHPTTFAVLASVKPSHPRRPECRVLWIPAYELPNHCLQLARKTLVKDMHTMVLMMHIDGAHQIEHHFLEMVKCKSIERFAYILGKIQRAFVLIINLADSVSAQDLIHFARSLCTTCAQSECGPVSVVFSSSNVGLAIGLLKHSTYTVPVIAIESAAFRTCAPLADFVRDRWTLSGAFRVPRELMQASALKWVIKT